ncbi:N-acetylneuraminate lyase subunit, partial [Streptococcus pneumoniae CCCB]
GEVSPERTRA